MRLIVVLQCSLISLMLEMVETSKPLSVDWSGQSQHLQLVFSTTWQSNPQGQGFGLMSKFVILDPLTLLKVPVRTLSDHEKVLLLNSCLFEVPNLK